MKIIKFGKKGCAPCEAVDAFLNSKNIDFTTINPFETDNEEELDLILENNIKTIPVTILINKNKEVVLRKAGYNEKALQHLIDTYNEQ